MSYLEAQHLSHSFKGTPVLKDVSFSCEKGETLCLMGPSGSGKTTILRILAGLIQPDQGTVLLEGANITNFKPSERHLAMVFQSPALFQHTKVRHSIGYGLHKLGYSNEQIEQLVVEAAGLLKIEDQLDKYPGTLSGGQAQRADIARAIVRKPEILLLDEPFSSLDQQLKEELMEEMKRIQKKMGMTMIFVTHDETEANILSDKIIHLNHSVS